MTAALFAVGCYVPPAQAPEVATVRLETPFNPQAIAWAEGHGDNRIEGTALLRTRGGEPRTCAALDVGIIPVSRHAAERMARLYGSLRGGFNPAWPLGNHFRWANDDERFYEHIRKTKCDAQGRFEFDALPDGDWFVEAVVTWEVPRLGKQGGSLMQRVRLVGGQTQRVVLSE